MPRGDESFPAAIRERGYDPPSILWKYCTREYAERIFQSSRICFSSPLRFNDPFDCGWDPYWQLWTDEFKALQREYLRAALAHNWPRNTAPAFRADLEAFFAPIRGQSEAEALASIDGMIEEIRTTSKTPPSVVEYFEKTRRNLRVFCLAEEPLLTLMWGHYAEQHAGVALGFHAGSLQSWLQRPLYRVRYSRTPPEVIEPDAFIRDTTFGTGEHVFRDDLALALTHVKSEEWAYEKEWRIAMKHPHSESPEGLLDLLEFPASIVHHVVAGCRFPSDRMDAFGAKVMAFNPECALSTVKKHPTGYALEHSPWPFAAPGQAATMASRY